MDYTHARMLERIVDRINALNNTQIEPNEVEIKAVGTKYSVTPKPGSRYYRMDLIQYSEIDIAKLFHGVPLHLTRTEGMTYADVIDWVNKTFALDMHQEDFGQDLTAALPETDGVIELEILDDCPFFMGTLSIDIRPDSILISAVWKTATLNLPLIDSTAEISAQTTYLTLPVTLGKVDESISGLVVDDVLKPRVVAQLSNAMGGADLKSAITVLNSAKVVYNGLASAMGTDVNLPPTYTTATHILVLGYLRPGSSDILSHVTFRYDL